jgi:hypothetical protein
MDHGILGGRQLGNLEQAHALSLQYCFSYLLAHVHVELVALGMNPVALAARGNRNVDDFSGRDELAGLNAWNQLADVQMDVALRLYAGRVICDGPLITEKRFRFGDGATPKLGALRASQ